MKRVAEIACREGVPLMLAGRDLARLEHAVDSLQRTLKPRFDILNYRKDGPVLNGIAGSIALGQAKVLTVAPKTAPATDWASSLIALLDSKDAIDIGGLRRTQFGPRRDIPESICTIYADRIDVAYRNEGPIMTIERLQTTEQMLRGKLDVSRWVSRAALEPHKFPTTRNVLTADNSYMHALSEAASILSASCSSPAVRDRLRRQAYLLSNRPATSSGQLIGANLPEAWKGYLPAWSMALAILHQASLLGTRGMQVGVSLCIELWPLLERLLARTLSASCDLAFGQGRSWTFGMQKQFCLLSPSAATPKLDGILFEGDVPVASFEAKYKEARPNGVPYPEDLYQAIAAARAANSPHAVIVYPGIHDGGTWVVESPGAYPSRVSTLYLDMFAYKRGVEMEHAKRLFKFVT